MGTKEEVIYENFNKLLKDEDSYQAMAKAENPYGDGVQSKNCWYHSRGSC